MSVPDDPSISTYGQDAGYCRNCGEHLDSGRCECSEEEREGEDAYEAAIDLAIDRARDRELEREAA